MIEELGERQNVVWVYKLFIAKSFGVGDEQDLVIEEYQITNTTVSEPRDLQYSYRDLAFAQG